MNSTSSLTPADAVTQSALSPAPLSLTPANIRNPAGFRGALVETPERLRQIWAKQAPCRVDLYRSPAGAQIACQWDDGSTFITDASSWSALTGWIARAVAAGLVYPHQIKQHSAKGVR